jgi:adenylosuccinate synthase
MQLDIDVLRAEIQQLAISADRLTIDPNAVVIDAQARELEQGQELLGRVASTMTGTGGAVARKVLRARDLTLARDVPDLAPYLGDVSEQLWHGLVAGRQVIVEGTQGLGLSLHHGEYPFATSRDTSAAAFLSECGVPPTAVTEVIVVLRTYPIRVGGNSGPLYNEISWQSLQERSGYPVALAEYTTVTGRLRRVAEFDWALAEKAVRINQPTALAIHGLDYVNYQDLGCRSFPALSERSQQFVGGLETRLGVPAPYLFTGPDGEALIDRAAHSAYLHERRATQAAAA